MQYTISNSLKKLFSQVAQHIRKRVSDSEAPADNPSGGVVAGADLILHLAYVLPRRSPSVDLEVAVPGHERRVRPTLLRLAGKDLVGVLS